MKQHNSHYNLYLTKIKQSRQMGIFWFFFISIINNSLTILAVDHPYSHCYSTSNSSDSSYFASRNDQLSTLADDVKTNAGVFKNQASPYCLGICRKDVMYSDACYTCINTSVSDVIHNCPVQHAVVAWGADADCIVHCLPPNTAPNTTQPSIYACNTTTVSKNYLSQFDNAIADLTFKLAVKAGQEVSQSPFPYGFQRPQYFATEDAKLNDLLTIYAAGFCLTNLTKSECTACLKTAANQSAVNCDGKQGAKIFMSSCVLRYELYPFYQNSATPLPPVSPPPRKKSRTKRTAELRIVLTIVTIVTLLVCITGIKTVLKRRKQLHNDKDDIVGTDSIESCSEFSFKAIRVATNDFSESNKLGQGGFGVVYQGRLSNGRLVAVKRLTRATAHGNAEFKNEVQLVARLHHKNLVRLIGFCLEAKERILIYELALNGSLDHILFDPNRREGLSWKIRYNIIEGITRGLLYLHEESQLRIIHRDLKASNVLLDESMNSKIADFGTARLFVEDQGSASRIVGTYGYMPPEYAKYGKISTKVDVFSFGVLLLEIISGRKNSVSFGNPRQIEHLLSKAWKCWTMGQHRELIDPVLLRESGHIDDMKRCIHIGLLCVQEKVASRPTMSEVVLVLDGCSQILPPPSEPAYLMEIATDAMEDISVTTINDSDMIYPTYSATLSSAGVVSVNGVSFSHTYPEPR